MFWADVNSGARIFARYPELFAQLPKDVIAVPWHYHVQTDYSGFVVPFAREKVPEVFAPGIWCWDEITPDFIRTFENIDGFLADARKYGTMGMINTGWTDASQVLYRSALPAWHTEPPQRGRQSRWIVRIFLPITQHHSIPHRFRLNWRRRSRLLQKRSRGWN